MGDDVEVNTSQKVISPANGDCNFQIICYILCFIALLGLEFNNVHLDTLLHQLTPN